MTDVRLEVTGGTGRPISIERVPFRIGRRAESDLVVSHGEVSRDHAEVVAVGSGYAIRDRGSRYGTFVNDEPVTERALGDGDRIRLGRIGGAEVIVHLRDAAGSAEPGASIGAATAADLRQVAALLEGLRALSSSRVLDDVLVLVMDSAIAVSGAERGFIMLANGDGALDLKLARACGRQTLPGSGFETSRKIPEEVFRTGRTRIEADLLDGDLANVHAGTVALGIRHVLCVPLRLMQFSDAAEAVPAEDAAPRRIGVLYLDSRDKAKLLLPSTEGALETLANEAAVAIRNAELYRAALENAKLEREMQTAAEIQQALLPNRQRSGAFFEAVAATLPCRSIGGDFFDYIECLHGTTGSACEPRLQEIFAGVERFTAGAPQHDDVTAMVVTYQPRASAAT
jgi:hypothetical protein